jgi:hypothetical protein
MYHSILLERLSAWFGITSAALSQIKSYMLHRFSYINVENTNFSVFKVLCAWCFYRIYSRTSSHHLIHHSSQYCHI